MDAGEPTASEKMIITYTVAEYTSEDRTVEVTYENSDGFIYKRFVNIPHFEDGSIDENYFQEILDGQVRGIENKTKIGVILFIDPNAEEVVEE
jgi:hypothetical protein